MSRTAATVFLLPFLLAGCAGSSSQTQPTAVPTFQIPLVSPAAFALTLTDVGDGFIQLTAAEHTNEQVARSYGLSAKELKQRGRVTSFETEFKRQSSSGLVAIDDVVASWHTRAGAQWDMKRVKKSVRGAPGISDTRHVAAHGLGTARFAYTFHTARQASNLVDYAVIFQRDRYRVYLQVIGIIGTFGDADVLRLARIIDGRIRRITH
jgi:hypothetical protein